jgi:ATP-binding cassette subfamily B protein
MKRRRWAASRSIVGALRLVHEASPRMFRIAVAFQVFGALGSAVLVYAGQLTLTSVFRDGDLTGLWLPLAALVAASAASAAAATCATQQQRLLAEDVSLRTWRDLLDVTAHVDLEVLESPSFAERLDRVQTTALGRPTAIATSCLGLLGSALTVGALTVTVFLLEPLLPPLLLLAGIPSLWLSRKAGRTEYDFAKVWSPRFRLRAYSRRLLTERAFAAEVRAFETQGELTSRHERLSTDYRQGLAAQVRRRQVYAMAGVAVTGMTLAITLAGIVALVDSGRMSLASAGAAIIAVRLLSGSLSRVFTSLGTLTESTAFLDDYTDFLRRFRTDPRPSRTGRELTSGLTVREARFTYPETGTEVLRGVDLDIAPGEIVALVGENGSGKTTLAKVVGGLFSMSSGSLLWDGQLVDDASRPEHVGSVSVIFQDFVRYELSVDDNISLDPALTADQRVEALRTVGLHEVVEALPNGSSTPLGRLFDGAVDLSGGQWQRLALARALARDSALVVLDEPSSALDPRAESELFGDLRARVGDRAVLLVSHRYSNLHLADRVYVMADGQVVESGSHDDLIRAGGLYARLYSLQVQAYKVH